MIDIKFSSIRPGDKYFINLIFYNKLRLTAVVAILKVASDIRSDFQMSF